MQSSTASHFATSFETSLALWRSRKTRPISLHPRIGGASFARCFDMIPTRSFTAYFLQGSRLESADCSQRILKRSAQVASEAPESSLIALERQPPANRSSLGTKKPHTGLRRSFLLISG